MQHIAMIMSGNRKWARKQGVLETYAHREEAIKAVQTAAQFCIKHSIPYLSLYTLSLENAERRGKEMVDNILRLVVKTCAEQAEELVKNGIRIRFIGQRDLIPHHVLPAVVSIEEKTHKGTKLTLSLLFYYGARQEMLHAMRAIAGKVQAGVLNPDQITDKVLREELWTKGLPDPELIIRTGLGNERRLSNFMLYQGAYSELQFLDTLWPEMTEQKLEECLADYNTVVRNFGA